MQSWPNAGQNGVDEQSHQQHWQANYAFANQNGQFDTSQSWGQTIGDQDAYSHINPQDAASSTFFDSSPEGASFLQPNQPSFHGGHDSLSLNQQFSQGGQDVIDPAFNDIHPDLYAQQSKLNLGDSLGHLSHVQGHPHASQQNFQYSFPPQNEHSFESPMQQFAQPQLLQQQSRQQQNHTPVQQFEGMQGNFAHGHGYNRPPSQQSPPQNQQHYHQNAVFPSAVNGQPTQVQQPTNQQLNYQPQQQPQPQQSQQQQQQQPQQQPPVYSQPQFIAQKHASYSPPVQAAASQNFQQPAQHQGPYAANSPPPPSTTSAQFVLPQQPVDAEPAIPQPAAVEPPAKKRKRATKAAAPETPTATPEPAITHVDSPSEPATAISLAKKAEEVDALVPPVPTGEDAQLLVAFNKRTKAQQAKHPAIKGLPYLVYDPSIKLPAPKSYDKLAPLVAVPSRSGKAMVPELGYPLPCEVQGRFTSLYRPSPDRGGLDERRIEAKTLLDDFDRSMKALGKRRPKYTEYPHAFKEQLKSDEASKNKAEKKAKKEQEEERSKPIRPPTRPADPAEAAVWDAIGMVHIDQHTPRTNALIATRVEQAGNFFIKLRAEMNRAKQELDQLVKDNKPEADISKARQESERKKEILYKALDATIEHADDAVIDNLAGHQKLILSLVNALIMCIKSGDFSGKLPKIVLELFTHFPMSKKIAETTNFETVRKRFADKGDTEVKDLVRDISAKVKKILKTTESDTTTGYTGTSAASRAKAAAKGPDPASAKRGRDEESDTRTVKKIAVESSGNSLRSKLAPPKILLQSASKTTAAKAAASSILAGKTRPVAKSVPKPDVSKTETKSATSEDKSTKAPVAPKMSTVSASASASALSGIASLLDSINAPKAELPANVTRDTKSPDASETPEEKAKRLRKEARRKLRVSWKPEAELVQVKIFQKEDAEDEGRESNMIRDAGDDRSEGMVLKQRADVDEEDEEDDVAYQPWLEPIAIDFSTLPDETRAKNFVTRGGNVTFSTEEQQRIAEREQRELMAIYTDPDDIPPTPKSPPPDSAAPSQWKTHQLPAEDPKFQEIHLRWRDEQQMGVDGALYTAAKRLDAKHNPSGRLDSILGRLKGASSTPQSGLQPSTTHHTSNVTSDNLPLFVGQAAQGQVLAILQSEKAKNWRDPQPISGDVWRAYHYTDATVRLCGNAIELATRSLSGKPYPATSPPEWILHDQERVREWQMGYNKEMLARQRKADEERARAEVAALSAVSAAMASGQSSNNAQDWAAYFSQQQYMAILQQMTGAQQLGQQQPQQQQQQQAQATASSQTSQLPDSQLQSILAAINQPSQQPPTQAQGSSVASVLNPNDPSYQQYMMLSQMAQSSQQQGSQLPPSGDRDRDWDNERDRNDEHGGGRNEPRDGKDGRRKRGTLPLHKPANKALIGTKPCTFWQQGKCARGDKCTFRHD